MLFPWGRTAALIGVMGFLSLLIYRVSETGGPDVSRACLAAKAVAYAAGLTGLYLIGRMWRRDIYLIMISIIAAFLIRLLIGGSGIAIIILFTSVHRTWFVVYVCIYYVIFLIIDTGFALWVLRHAESNKQEKNVHGNLWDMVS